MQQRDWPWWRVRGELEERGWKLKDLALTNGYTNTTVQKAKQIPIPSVQALIAETLERRPEEIWPSRYDHGGRPVRRYLWLKKSKAA